MVSTRTHPLKAWRLSQIVDDARLGARRSMNVAEAARALGVPYQTWYGWERDGTGPREEALVIRLYRLTKGQVRPDHCYPLPDLRAEAASEAARVAAATQAGARP